MEVYLFYLLFGILFWVIGSIPSGYLIVRLIEGKDVFLAGNGNPGLNNINENFGAQLTVMLGISDLIVKVLIPSAESTDHGKLDRIEDKFLSGSYRNNAAKLKK